MTDPAIPSEPPDEPERPGGTQGQDGPDSSSHGGIGFGGSVGPGGTRGPTGPVPPGQGFGPPVPGMMPPDLGEFLGSMLGPDGTPTNPEMAEALSAMGIDKIDPSMMGMIAAQLQTMFAGDSGEPFNLELATDVARKTVAAQGDSVVAAAARREVEEAVQVAGLWLDEATSFSAPGVASLAWSRAEWVDQTMPVWRALVEPVAAGVGAAIVTALRSQLGEAAEHGGLGDAGALEIPGMPAGMDPAALLGQMEPMLAKMSSSMFGMQVGQAVGALAGDLVSGTEVGLPLVPGHAVALLPANVAAFSEGLEIDPGEVRLYLAAREAARVRLFADVPWLGPQLVSSVQAYARDISIDTDRIEQSLQSVDTSDPAAIQSALQDSLFAPEPSAAQRAALERLETYLALVEGWVDVVADQATREHLPHASALGEVVRRRRASGGPAEKIFSGLVGLELRPRRLRDAANLWSALQADAGTEGRDAAWAHPDLAPTAADLDDPLGYVERLRPSAGGDDMDAARASMLTEGADQPGPADGDRGRRAAEQDPDGA